MLNFVFDLNALVHLFDRSDYSQIKVNIGHFLREGYIRIWLTSTNLSEMLVGVTGSNFNNRKESLAEAVTLAQDRFFFPIPTKYLFLQVRKLGLSGMLEKAAIIRELYADVLSIPDFQTYQEKNSSVLEDVGARNGEFFRNVCDAQEPELEKSAADRKSASEAKCGEDRRLSYLRASVIHLLSMYAPELAPDPGEQIDLMLLLRCRPSILYYSELLRVFGKKTYLNKRRVRQSDGYDFTYALYLDVCDYLVTDDGPLRSMIKETNLTELHGRAITLEEFLESLSSPFLFPRSPIWIDNTYGH